MKRSWAGEVRNVSLLVASAVNCEDAMREILGICEGVKEDKSGWSAFLRHLVDRGLKGVQLIISDACRGLIESAADYLPEARWQRCMVQFYRNVFSHVPATKIGEVSHMLKAIHAQESREAANQKAKAIIEDLRASKMQQCSRPRRRSPALPRARRQTCVGHNLAAIAKVTEQPFEPQERGEFGPNPAKLQQRRRCDSKI